MCIATQLPIFYFNFYPTDRTNKDDGTYGRVTLTSSDRSYIMIYVPFNVQNVRISDLTNEVLQDYSDRFKSERSLLNEIFKKSTLALMIRTLRE